MELRKIIRTTIHEYLNENVLSINDIDFDTFPNDVLKTLEGEYGHYYLYNFDWNNKQDEFMDNPEGFREWLKLNKKEEFIKSLDKLIQKTRQDLILLIKQKNADKALKQFEELIIPALDNSILVEPLSKFMEFALLNLHNTKEIEEAYIEAQNIIEKDGSINYAKIKPSSIFTGDGISLPNFERFARKNPEYKGVFKDWKKLFDKSIELSLIELNAHRDSTPYKAVRNLYNFLIKIRGEKLIREELRTKTKIGHGKDHAVYDFEHDPTKVIKVAWDADSGGNRYDTNTKKTIVDFDPNHIKMFKKYPNLFARVYKETNRYAIIEKLDVNSVREDEKELFNQISSYNFYDLQYMKEHNTINTLYWNVTNRKGFLGSLIKQLEKNNEDLTLLNKYIILFKEINKTLKRIVRSVDVGSYNLGYDKDYNLKLLDF